MRVILAAGGSGGHIFPSLALASGLEKRQVKELFFVSSKRTLDKRVLEDAKCHSYFLSVNPMPLEFRPIRFVVFLFKMISDFIASIYIILKVRPDVVVGFGGYSSGTIVKAANLFKVPIILHEQNLVPGRANSLLSRSASRIAVSFKESVEHFPFAKDKVVYTGNPLRLDIMANDRAISAQRLGLRAKCFTVLTIGGSQGSSFLNSVAREAAGYINKERGHSIQFVHITGKKDYELIKHFYDDNKIPGRVFSFLDRIDDAYSVCDLAISRSGASAIFELAFYAKPMILIPYPNPKNNQVFNARYFSQKGAALYKEEKSLTAFDLAKEILEILDNKERWQGMAYAAKRLSAPQAAALLAEEVIRVGERVNG